MSDNVFNVKVKRWAFKALERLPRDYRLRILEALDELSINPIPFKKYDLKKPKGYEDTFRIRVGDIRIIYTINWDPKSIIVHYIGPRERAYK
ncbi:MAG: type II toxin-antitoxin system RelE/ParE family toxin [Caldisphaeraceae archaeon]|nr:type II toxin-antitoxin system RelE/ParE family toxin [Caldisphaeraceae archaeon]MEB3692257.1 type II toxin-antitoxin system RelE/ParE family toxin [Caldisphaeraceae archaeon]MEB3798321.1 type II toxin-antitoxin system RelE/ParE family toxin [Caldisphaeraceae archaeon]